MIYLYIALLILPLSFVLFEQKLNAQKAVYYSGVIGGSIWAVLTFLLIEDWSFVLEPLFLVVMSLLALQLKKDELFKYQPCITQGVLAAILMFNGSLFDLGQRYLGLVQEFVSLLTQFKPYLYFNCYLGKLIVFFRGETLDTDYCVEQLQLNLETLNQKLPWETIINNMIDVCIYPLIFHSLILFVIVYKGLDSVIWLAVRLMIYPMILLAQLFALGSLLFNQ